MKTRPVLNYGKFVKAENKYSTHLQFNSLRHLKSFHLGTRLVKERIPDWSTGPYLQIMENKNRHARGPVHDHPFR